jgi:hypothetical protein
LHLEGTTGLGVGVVVQLKHQLVTLLVGHMEVVLLRELGIVTAYNGVVTLLQIGVLGRDTDEHQVRYLDRMDRARKSPVEPIA